MEVRIGAFSKADNDENGHFRIITWTIMTYTVKN